MPENPSIEFGAAEAQLLLEWFRRSGVRYPWTGLTDPWAIWVSEVMLQQTTVRTVRSRFPVWMDKYPSPAHLAAAGEDEYLKDWEGLGYYNRARNLVSAAAELTRSFDGRVPRESSELIKLPGVGPYIASAVAAFAFSEPVAAVDANGRRIAMRLAASGSWSKSLEREFRRKLEAQMGRPGSRGPGAEDPAEGTQGNGNSPAADSGELNGALMQLGQLVCTPTGPSCSDCPLRPVCRARKKGLQNEIPGRRGKQIIRKESRINLFLRDTEVFLIKRRSGIGRGLWVFPAEDADADVPDGWTSAADLSVRIHTYTKYREELRPRILLSIDQPAQIPDTPDDAGEWTEITRLPERPMPTAYRRIADELVRKRPSLV